MEKLINAKSLSAKEEQIISATEEKSKSYVIAFICVQKYYRITARLGKSNHYPVFTAIYVDRLKMPSWKLANHCKVAESTLFRMRNEIIECFKACLRTIQLENIAAKMTT